MTVEFRAQRTKSILQCGSSDDGKYGLIGFRRERPDSTGNDSLWIGVPTGLLPHLAVSIIGAIPQPEKGLDGNHPAVFDLETIQFGVGPSGEKVLTLTFELGAALSVRLDEGQARALAEGLSVAFGKPDVGSAPSGSKLN